MFIHGQTSRNPGEPRVPETWSVDDWLFTRCERCKRPAIWIDDQLVYPDFGGGPPPSPDLPDDIRDDYLEAQSIAARSPRGAAALLRLSIQKLCKQLGEPGENINADIASLVKKGLPARVQQALDVVRVIGNNAVHPGQIDLKDDSETAAALFDLVNLIAQVMISEPKAVQEMYDKLPQSALDAIAKRDQAKPSTRPGRGGNCGLPAGGLITLDRRPAGVLTAALRAGRDGRQSATWVPRATSQPVARGGEAT